MLDAESSLALSSLLEMLFPSYRDILSFVPSKFWGLVERRFDYKEPEHQVLCDILEWWKKQQETELTQQI